MERRSFCLLVIACCLPGGYQGTGVEQYTCLLGDEGGFTSGVFYEPWTVFSVFARFPKILFRRSMFPSSKMCRKSPFLKAMGHWVGLRALVLALVSPLLTESSVRTSCCLAAIGIAGPTGSNQQNYGDGEGGHQAQALGVCASTECIPCLFRSHIKHLRMRHEREHEAKAHREKDREKEKELLLAPTATQSPHEGQAFAHNAARGGGEATDRAPRPTHEAAGVSPHHQLMCVAHFGPF